MTDNLISRRAVLDAINRYHQITHIRSAVEAIPASDALESAKAENERLRNQRDTFARSFRDACSAQNRLVDRAEKAEAERGRLREALAKIAAGEGIYGLQAAEYKAIARAALDDEALWAMVRMVQADHDTLNQIGDMVRGSEPGGG